MFSQYRSPTRNQILITIRIPKVYRTNDFFFTLPPGGSSVSEGRVSGAAILALLPLLTAQQQRLPSPLVPRDPPGGWTDETAREEEGWVRNWIGKLLRTFGIGWVFIILHAKERSSARIIPIHPRAVQIN